MRILFLTGWFPYPPDNGARIRVYHLLRQMASRHQVGLVSFNRRTEDVGGEKGLDSLCDVLGTVPWREFRPLRARAVLGLWSMRPRSLVDTFSPLMNALVRQALDRHRFDLILASEIGPGTGVSQYIREYDSIPRVIEDLELSMIRSKIEAQPTVGAQLRHRLTWVKLRRYARKLLWGVDGCTVASEREQETVLSIVPDYRPLMVVPNGVDVEDFAGDFGSVEPDTMVFPGALTYRANFDAMAFFLSGVLPRLKAQQSNVRLYITGRTDGVMVDRLPIGDGVVLTGHLDDVRPRIARSQVCVVPMTVGGGTRLKILEAMALGTPVVSTSKGAEGLDVTPGKDILIADEPQAFAEAVLRLMRDEGLRAGLSENGRHLVREEYDWRMIGAKLNAFLEEVVAGREGCFVQ